MQKNNTNSENLDSTIKESLESFEVPYNPSHWDEMEKMLDGTPKAYASFKGWTWGLNTLIGVALLSGGYLIYAFTGSSESGSSVKTEAKEERIAPSASSAPAVTVNKPSSISSSPVTESALTETQVSVVAENQQPSGSPGMLTAAPYQKRERVVKDEAQAVKKEETNTDARDEIDFSKMDFGRSLNNVATFGDQIDSKAGFTKPTGENGAYVKEAQDKIGEQVKDGFASDQLKKDSMSGGSAPEVKEDTAGPSKEGSDNKKPPRRRSRKEKEGNN